MSWRDDSITIKFIDIFLENVDLFALRFTYFGFCSVTLSCIFFSFIGSIKSRSIKSSFNGGLIQYNAIFLVVARETRHGHNRISSYRHFKHRNMFCWLGCDKRSLRIVQQMIEGFHSYLSIECIYSHSLLRHGTLKSVFCGLVVVRERDD